MENAIVGLIFQLFRTTFYLLYHQFAWTYDMVAATVSLGRWKGWVRQSIPYLQGRILEIGFGPGHLQQALHERGSQVFGVDESHQMAQQAKRRLRRKGFPSRLVRGVAQQLPFQDGVFDTVVATFPSEYIFDPSTLREARRVLVRGGRLVILPMAWITGNLPWERLAAWLFRITGQAADRPRPITAAVREQFMRAGFEVRNELVQVKGSQLLFYIATSSTYP